MQGENTTDCQPKHYRESMKDDIHIEVNLQKAIHTSQSLCTKNIVQSIDFRRKEKETFAPHAMLVLPIKIRRKAPLHPVRSASSAESATALSRHRLCAPDLHGCGLDPVHGRCHRIHP